MVEDARLTFQTTHREAKENRAHQMDPLFWYGSTGQEEMSQGSSTGSEKSLDTDLLSLLCSNWAKNCAEIINRSLSFGCGHITDYDRSVMSPRKALHKDAQQFLPSSFHAAILVFIPIGQDFSPSTLATRGAVLCTAGCSEASLRTDANDTSSVLTTKMCPGWCQSASSNHPSLQALR